MEKEREEREIATQREEDRETRERERKGRKRDRERERDRERGERERRERETEEKVKRKGERMCVSVNDKFYSHTISHFMSFSPSLYLFRSFTIYFVHSYSLFLSVIQPILLSSDDDPTNHYLFSHTAGISWHAMFSRIFIVSCWLSNH